MTAASRVKRLCVATEFPDENLILIGKFILKVYAEMLFRMKSRPQVQNGPAHLFHMLNALRVLYDSLVSTIFIPVIQGNAFFFAHPENVLLAMISDEQPHFRKLV